VIRQELTVSENENAIALTRYAAEGAGPRPGRFGVARGGWIRGGCAGVCELRYSVRQQRFGRLSSALLLAGLECALLTAGTPGQRRFQAQSNSAAAGSIGSRRFARLLARWAVTIASARDRRVGAAVIFYGFVPSDDQRTQTDHLPPLLVLHGSSDENVSLESGRTRGLSGGSPSFDLERARCSRCGQPHNLFLPNRADWPIVVEKRLLHPPIAPLGESPYREAGQCTVRLPVRVKKRRTQCENMFSGLPCRRHPWRERVLDPSQSNLRAPPSCRDWPPPTRRSGRRGQWAESPRRG
jgi:hypothetical protein